MYVLLTAWADKQALYSCLLSKALIIEVIFIAFKENEKMKIFSITKKTQTSETSMRQTSGNLKQEFSVLSKSCHRSLCFISNQASLAKDEKYL